MVGEIEAAEANSVAILTLICIRLPAVSAPIL